MHCLDIGARGNYPEFRPMFIHDEAFGVHCSPIFSITQSFERAVQTSVMPIRLTLKDPGNQLYSDHLHASCGV